MSDTNGTTPDYRYLIVDLRDGMLDLVRQQRDPWQKLGEKQQTIVAGRAEQLAHDLVGRALEAIAAKDYPVIAALMKQAKVKDMIEASFTVSKSDPLRHQLFDAVNKPFLAVLADPAMFHAGRAAVVDKDQPSLPEIDPASMIDEPEPPIELDDSGLGDTVVDVVEPAPTVVAYNLGFAESKAGKPFDECEYEKNTVERLWWDAGWLACQVEESKDNPTKVQEWTVSSRTYFRDVGRFHAADEGASIEDCPFADWMPARGWWLAGFQSILDEKAQAAQTTPRQRRRGKGNGAGLSA